MGAQPPTARVLLGETGPSAPAVSGDAFGRRAAQALWAAGSVLLIGTLLDWLVLWLLQRQPSTQWEYVAFQNSLEAIPRAAIGLALIAGGLHLGRVRSTAAFRALGAAFLMLALAAAAIGVLLVMEYFVLGKMAAGRIPAAHAMLKTVTARSLGLSVLFALVLGTTGLVGMRRLRA